VPTQGRGELREQPTTGRWSRGDTNRLFGSVATRTRGVRCPIRGVGSPSGRRSPSGSRGTARSALHRPVVAWRQRLPLSGRDDPRAADGWSRRSPRPWRGTSCPARKSPGCRPVVGCSRSSPRPWLVWRLP